MTELYCRHDRVAVYDGAKWHAGVVMDKSWDWLLTGGKYPGGATWVRRIRRSAVHKLVRMVRVVGGVKYDLEKRA